MPDDPDGRVQDWLFRMGAPIPEPGSMLLLGTGLLALLASRRRLRKAS